MSSCSFSRDAFIQPAPGADTQRVAPSGASDHDSRFHRLIGLSRRTTSSLDLLEVTEDLGLQRDPRDRRGDGAIALWDRERDVLVTPTDIEVVHLGSTTSSGAIYTRLEDYPATRGVLAERRASASVSIARWR